MKYISKPQIKKLRALASKVFPDDEIYHEWLSAQFGVDSTKKLSTSEAHRAIQMLLPDGAGRGAKGGYYPRGSGYYNHLTEKQAKNIGGLAADLGWPQDGLVKFIKRQTGKDKTVEMLSVKEATKVILGLERVLKHKQDYPAVAGQAVGRQTLFDKGE